MLADLQVLLSWFEGHWQERKEAPMRQAALLQWDQSLGSKGLQATGTRMVPSVTNTSAGLLQVMSAQSSTCSPLCQGERLIGQVLVPAVFVPPEMISVSHLEQLQGHVSAGTGHWYGTTGMWGFLLCLCY